MSLNLRGLAIAEIVQNITEQRKSSLRFPSDQDLTGAAVALTRLQDTYLLDTHSLAQGEIMGKKHTRELSGILNLTRFTKW